MSDPYRIFGVELSPYSVKIRSYFRYKRLPHTWIVRNAASMADYQKFAKLPIIPLVVTPDDQALQDSTPIMEHVDARHPEPATLPEDPVCAFLSQLIEEFGDEWGNKWMFHYRWWRDVDQIAAAERLAGSFVPEDADDEMRAGAAAMIRARMKDRVWFVGSSEKTKDQIEGSFLDAVEVLDTHLASRSYLLGGRPAMGDFGLYAQLYECMIDPTAGELLRSNSANVIPWIERMLEPEIEGDFELWADLAPTLGPLLERQVGRLFLPWSISNAKAIAEEAEDFTVDLGGKVWSQKPQKYHARSLLALREKYRQVRDKTTLDAILEKHGCLQPML
jgi:glutathione S-transferase